MNFDEMINGKKILFIPIYSMRDYKTGLYNLLADGNMARIYSKIKTAKPKESFVAIPENIVIYPNNSFMDNKNITWLPCNAYGINAKETRNEVDKFVKFINNIDLKIGLDNFDYIILEPNLLTLYFVRNFLSKYQDKLIYWCVASVTSETCPWFVKDYIDTDTEIANKITTIVSLPNQQKALRGKTIIDYNFYNAEIFDYPIIYFPFRISDVSYKFDILLNAINNIYNEGVRNFKVLYTDPNNSLDEDKNIPARIKPIFKKIPTDKEIYLSILRSKPIIPYLEDSNNMIHISIFEFMYYHCDVIMFENNSINFDEAIFIKDINSLEVNLKNKILEKGAKYIYG